MHLGSHLLPARLWRWVVIGAGTLVLWVACGVRFANYDTLYALAWGGQLWRGEVPSYWITIAPTPHPLIEVLGLLLAPLPPHTIIVIAVALGYLAMAGCGWVIYRLGSEWFGRPAGAFAALIMLTRVPVLSYGPRTYIDIPYLMLVLWALLVETRRRRAGAPVLALLALAGLLRPEAWFFSGLYWLYLVGWVPRRWRSSEHVGPTRTRSQLAWLALLGASAPIIWVLSDLLVTGDPLWSLTNTRHTAQTLHRYTGIANVPQYIPRRIGEILRPPVLAGAALGGVMSLLWLRERTRLGASVGVAAVAVFVVMAAAGLPINTRYAFLAAAILAIFCGVGAFGWLLLESDDPHRRWWSLTGAAVLVAFLAFAPSQYNAVQGQLKDLKRQQRIEDDLVALVNKGSIKLRCGPVEVTNHAPIPLLALYLKASPARIVSAQSRQITDGTYVEPANPEVEEDYVLDPHDPVPRQVTVPPGFTATHTSRSWLIFEKCGDSR